VKTFGLFSEWHWVLGAQISRRTVILLCFVAFLAIVVSGLSLLRERKRGRVARLFALRTSAVLLCLFIALQPRLEFGHVTVVPNHVAVLVDSSRSMSVTPPERGPSRAVRAKRLLTIAEPRLAEWAAQGHPVVYYTFAETISASTKEGLSSPPTGDGTHIAEALGALYERLAGRDLGAVVILSDGIDTGRLGKGPLDDETRKILAALNVPVHTILLGEDNLRDLSIAAVWVDDFAFVRSPIKIEAVVRHSGLADRVVEVSLLREGKVVDVKMVPLRQNVAEERVIFTLIPDRPGDYVFEIKTPVLTGEALESNNYQMFTLKVIRDRVRVLHVCGRPSWDERFLRSLLRLNPNVDLVSFFILRTDMDEMPFGQGEMSLIPFPYEEIFDEQLRTFDLLVFHNFNFKPYRVEPYLPGVRRYIEEGGALAMIGGDLSFASGLYGSSALAEVLPVDLSGIPPDGGGSYTTDPFHPRLSKAGQDHPVTVLSLDEKENRERWAALPPLVGINRVSGLMPGAHALLVHPNQKSKDGKMAPVLAVREVGRGRTLALLTDTAWHWSFLAAGAGQDGRVFQRFWESAIRWLVRDPALTLLRIELGRPDYRREQIVQGRVRTLHADFSPAAGVPVTIELLRVDAEANLQRTMQFTTSTEGESAVEFGVLDPGAYRLVGRARIEGRPVETQATFIVRPEGKELEDIIARGSLLEAISKASGGNFRVGTWGDFSVRPPRTVRVGSVRTVEVWSHPLLFLLVIGLLAAEWTLRRRAGHG
jgi:uncharacterized membrane protein